MKNALFLQSFTFSTDSCAPGLPTAKSGTAPQRNSSTHENCTHIEMKLKQNSFKQLHNCFVSVSFQCADSLSR